MGFHPSAHCLQFIWRSGQPNLTIRGGPFIRRRAFLGLPMGVLNEASLGASTQVASIDLDHKLEMMMLNDVYQLTKCYRYLAFGSPSGGPQMRPAWQTPHK